MGTRQLNRLSAKAVAAKKNPGLHCDGGGLYLQVTPSGTKTWIFRFRSPVTRKLRDMGLGALHSVGLPEAREKAAAQRAALGSGLDPIEARDQENRRKAMEAAKTVTFAQCAASYIESHKAGWRNPKHCEQWTNTLGTYAAPVIGSLPVQDVDTGLVLKVLEPIWSRKPETASRLRGRIENILDWAKARGYRSAENPARWKGHLNQLLPALSKKHRVTHHKAMPFAEVGVLVAKLQELESVAARCLEFTILTAARTNEATQARPEEFDLAAATWTVPASRMKAKKEHRVPLSARAVEIVRDLLKLKQTHVFPSSHRGEPISNMAMLHLLGRLAADVTVHGFRSRRCRRAIQTIAWPRSTAAIPLRKSPGFSASHRHTVREWIKRGLPTIDSQRPALILGRDLSAFLQARRNKNKRSCQPGEIYCVRCRIPRTPAGDMAEYQPLTPTLGNLVGICSSCESLMYRRVNLAKLSQIRGKLDVSIPQALRHIA